jgi:hypothetical protein
MVDGFYRPWKSNKKTKVNALLLCSPHRATHLRAAAPLPVPHHSVLVLLAYVGEQGEEEVS